jgi:hypothetical protein
MAHACYVYPMQTVSLLQGKSSFLHLTDLTLEPVSTPEFSGNAPIRVPYIGYDMNSVLYEAEGVANYDALQLQVASGSRLACNLRPPIPGRTHWMSKAVWAFF